jgi:quinol-cytochrome oxidoreductase complex cytochrome b subunit
MRAIARIVRSKRVPEHRHSIWYYLGGLALFLLLVMVASGLLLSTYYEPSAGPAVNSDGTPLAAAVVTRPLEWRDVHYQKGDVIALPLNESSGEVIASGALKGNVETLKDSITHRAIRPSAAWVSVEGRIMHDVEFGSLVRSIHGYAANLLVIVVLLHMASAFFMRAYRSPRRMIWVTGFVLLLLILGFAFTGYLLPWNSLAFFATRVGVSLPERNVPLLGPAAASLLRGGDEVSGLTLTRMYSAHVIALPLATVIFAGLHVLLLQVFGLAEGSERKRRGGMMVAGIIAAIAVALLVAVPLITGAFDPTSPLILAPLAVLPVVAAYLLSAMAMTFAAPTPAASMAAERATQRNASREEPTSRDDENEPASVPFYSNYIYRDYLCWLLTFGVIITLAVAAPWGHHGALAMPVDLTKPLLTPEGIHPEWYFMFAYQLLRFLPGTAAIAALGVVGLLILSIPWLDRDRNRRSIPLVALAIVLIIAFIALSGG